MSKFTFFFRFIALALLTLMVTVPASARELASPKLIAVYFYADWCSNCKILEPNMAEARKQGTLDKKDILFVTLDLSNKPAIHQSILHAQALGIGEFLKAQGSSTGYVAVLDADSKKKLARFDRESSAEAIKKQISGFLISKSPAK